VIGGTGPVAEHAAPRRIRIAVIGAGGVGGYFAAALARAGSDVRLLARGEHLAAIRQRGGVLVQEPDGASDVAPVIAVDHIDDLQGCAVALLTVKSYSLPELAPLLRTLGRDGTTIVPLLNGVDILDRLVAMGVPAAAVLPGLTYISAARTAPGVVRRASSFRRIVVGEPSGAPSDRATALVTALGSAGIEAEISPHIALDLWRKLAFLAPMAAVCGLARRELGAVLAAPFGREVLERAVREVAAVSRAVGVALDEADVQRTLARLVELPPGTKPSLLLDLERHAATELDALSGTLARLGRLHGVETPVHDTVVAALSAAGA